MRLQRARGVRRTDRGAAFEGIDERVVTRLDRMRQRRTRGKLDIEIQRVGCKSLDRPRRDRSVDVQRTGDHSDSRTARKHYHRYLAGLDVAVTSRLHFLRGGQIDPELETSHAARVLLWHFGVNDAAAGSHPLHAAALQFADV